LNLDDCVDAPFFYALKLPCFSDDYNFIMGLSIVRKNGWKGLKIVISGHVAYKKTCLNLPSLDQYITGHGAVFTLHVSGFARAWILFMYKSSQPSSCFVVGNAVLVAFAPA
jgi:hypothetical protein